MQKQVEMSDILEKENVNARYKSGEIKNLHNEKEIEVVSYDEIHNEENKDSTNKCSGLSTFFMRFKRKSKNLENQESESALSNSSSTCDHQEQSKVEESVSTSAKQNKKISIRHLFFKKRPKNKTQNPEINLETITYDNDDIDNNTQQEVTQQEVTPQEFIEPKIIHKTKRKPSVLFVKKNYNSSNNTLYTKDLKDNSKKTFNKDVIANTSKIQSLDNVITENTEQIEVRSSTTKLSKSDLDDKSLTSNEFPSTSSMCPLHINSNYPLTVSSDTLTCSNIIEKDNEKNDCEVALLFVNQNNGLTKIIKYRDLENCISGTGDTDSHELAEPTFLQSELARRFLLLNEGSSVKCVDKATSTSALVECVNSLEETPNVKLELQDSTSLMSLPTMGSDQPDDSNGTHDSNDEILLSKSSSNDRWPKQPYHFGKLETDFMNTHAQIDNNDSYNINHETTVESESSDDLYASFKKSYISVTQKIPTSKWHIQTNLESHLTTHFEHSDTHETKNSEISQISNNTSHMQLYKSGQTFKDTNYIGDFNENIHFLTKLGLPQFEYRLEDELNTHINFKDANACLNMLTNKLHMMDTLYTKKMKTVSLENPNLTQAQYTTVDILFGNQNSKSLFESLQDRTIKYKENKSVLTFQPIDNESNPITRIGQSSDFAVYKPQGTTNLISSKSEMSTKSNSVNTHTLLSRKFKRDYISVRGKSMKIRSIEKNSNMPHKLKHIKVLRERSTYNLEKMYKELANDKDFATFRKHRSDARLNLKEFVKADNEKSHEIRTSKVIKQSSKLSLSISQESLDESDSCDEYSKMSQGKRKTKHFKKEAALTISERKQVLFPRIYSDFSLENRCNPKAHKYLFKNFQ